MERCLEVSSYFPDARKYRSILRTTAIRTNGECELRGSPLIRAVKFTELTRRAKV